MSTTLKIGVCVFPLVTILDYQGPMEILGFLDKNLPREFLAPELTPNPPPKYNLEIVYLGYSKDPIKPITGPILLADETYEESLAKKEQFDIILIPGGPGATPQQVRPVLLDFLKFQAPGAKYILTVCTGSWVLAQAGLLDGKRATTNKFTFKHIQDATKDQPITWVAKARWVVDGKFWTASGVTAGADMGYAFLKHLVGEKIANVVRGLVELSNKAEDDDEFAEVHGLL
ncbi:class I glutamine amidotransferase-like protein [Abortiporus biennis]|nr:class I glutamine amidotransferase-like protein [Abortiporus biennis]